MLATLVAALGAGAIIWAVSDGRSAPATHPRCAPVRACAPRVKPGLVLTPADVGPGYRYNTGVSGPRTLETVSADDTPDIKSILKRDWRNGTEAAFNGRSTSVGIVSIADVFRPETPVNTVLGAWKMDAIKAVSGSAERLPANAPGASPVLIKGTVMNYDVLLYMWGNGNTIASVELIGKPGALRVPELMMLAKRQQSEISACGANLTKCVSAG